MIRALLVAGLLATPVAAQAFTLGLDLDPAWVINSRVQNRTGYGVSLRLVNDLSIPEVKLQLEVGGGLRGFSSDHPAGIDSTLYQVFGGGRVSFGEGLHPGFYAHVGYGLGTEGGSEQGLYLEGGVFANLALPTVSVGVHLAYQSFLKGLFLESDAVESGQGRPNLVVLGVHGALTF